MQFNDFWDLSKQTFQEWQEDKVSRLAAALSYYATFSIAPLLVLVIAIVAFVYGSQSGAQQGVINQVQQVTGSQQTANFLQSMIAGARERVTGGFAAVIGIATLFWAATNLFTHLQEALNTIWGVEPAPGQGIWKMVKDRFWSFLMIIGIGFFLLAFMVVSATISSLSKLSLNLFPGAEWVFHGLNLLISFLLFTGFFAVIYKYLPDVEIKWSDVWLGAAVTALLFVIGQFLIGLYLGSSAVGDVYGAAGSLIVILLWIYYSAQIMFLGAEFTQVYARRYGSQIVPEEDAVALTKERRMEQGIPQEETLKAAAARQKGATGAGPYGAVLPATGPTTVSAGWRVREPVQPLPVETTPKPVGTLVAVMAALVGFLGGLITVRLGGKS